MTLEEVGDWARKWWPLIAIPIAIIAIIQRQVAAFGRSWIVAGFAVIAVLSLILGYLIRYKSTPAPHSPQPSPPRPSFRGTFYHDMMNWPYKVEISDRNPRESKVIHMGIPICAGCQTEVIIEQVGEPEIFDTILTCPQAGVRDKRSCHTPREREGSLEAWQDFVRKHIEGEIRKGEIKPTLPNP